jgi:predicted dehydrogenase
MYAYARREKQMIKIAMIGAGGYAYTIIKRLWQMPDKYELVAVTSNPARKSAGAQDCKDKGVSVYPDVDELLKNITGKCEVIFIPTPINTHYSLSKKCLDAGFNVFLEKPPVATIQDLDNLASCAQNKARGVAVMFQYLYSSIVQQLKERIVAGEFGTVRRVKAIAGWPRLDSYYNRNGWAGKIKVNGEWVLDGTVNNPLAHMLANQLYFASMAPGKMAEPATVQAELYHGHDIESEDTSSLRIITVDGVEIIFNATLCSERKIDSLVHIECDKATIEYLSFKHATIRYQDGRTEQITDENDKSLYMLERLSESFEAKRPYTVTLETSRPFVVCMNGVFESSKCTYAIDEKYIKRYEQEETVKTVIEGIDDILSLAHSSGKLFSEIGVEWAKKTKSFDVQSYKQFPSFGFKY